jgi:hypothetical protein
MAATVLSLLHKAPSFPVHASKNHMIVMGYHHLPSFPSRNRALSDTRSLQDREQRVQQV